MADFRGTIRSDVLDMDTHLTVVLPFDRPVEGQQTPCKALYLLHGLSDNCESWIRNTRIEQYAREKGIAVIMPEVQRSFYTDMVYGMRYFTFITQELPELCGKLFHISGKREDTFVAGLSMGGYGAMKCGLTYPERYAGCASFSGAVDVSEILRDFADEPQRYNENIAILGQELKIPDDGDIFKLAEKVAALPAEKHPQIYFTCGYDDFLYKDNVAFKAHLETLPIKFTYKDWPGNHTWDFWDVSVRQMLDLFLPD